MECLVQVRILYSDEDGMSCACLNSVVWRARNVLCKVKFCNPTTTTECLVKVWILYLDESRMSCGNSMSISWKKAGERATTMRVQRFVRPRGFLAPSPSFSVSLRVAIFFLPCTFPHCSYFSCLEISLPCFASINTFALRGLLQTVIGEAVRVCSLEYVGWW
jgi:hypothetical protein